MALPVLECIDCVSDVGGVDQAPQDVVVEVVQKPRAIPRPNSRRANQCILKPEEPVNWGIRGQNGADLGLSYKVDV
ncbi:hypothetical protein BU166_06505 [Corynebacterium diphtheriae]|nr:hypothetical protein B1A52_05985 [Corynebacterium diphtheriae]OWM41775.1 hypothetical protein BU159_04670 [Corynebacterium diphtheriae]OWM59730.1 hypothetical protein BU166_06505 [Corynebacterium diphtheriae]OWX98848.1 hypothetical protein B1A53_06445 [Corynebacterium diphtheriae]